MQSTYTVTVRHEDGTEDTETLTLGHVDRFGWQIILGPTGRDYGRVMAKGPDGGSFLDIDGKHTLHHDVPGALKVALRNDLRTREEAWADAMHIDPADPDGMRANSDPSLWR